MPFELIEIALAERQQHPRLVNRVTGKVRVVLTETIDGQEQRHELFIQAWTDVREGMDDGDIEMALMVKAAGIVGRMRSRMADAGE